MGPDDAAPTRWLRRLPRILLWGGAAGCALGGAAGCALVQPAPPPPLPPATLPAFAVHVDRPGEDAVVEDAPRIEVSGAVRVDTASSSRLDVVFAIDVSGRAPGPPDPRPEPEGPEGPAGGRGPPVLAAELEAIAILLGRLEPGRARAGLVSFAGYEPARRPEDGGSQTTPAYGSARTEEPLLDDFRAVADALVRVGRRGPPGYTDLVGGIDRAVAELTGRWGARSRPDPAPEKLLVVLTDGYPTLPDPRRPALNERHVVQAAERAAAAGVRIVGLAIGPAAVDHPRALEAATRVTGGLFVPVREIADLPAIVSQLRFVPTREVTVLNRSTGAETRAPVGLAGGWHAEIGLATGRNLLEIRAGDGGSASRTVHFAPDPVLPAEPAQIEAPGLDPAGRRELELRPAPATGP